MENTKRRKTRQGVVVSDKMDKTVVVRVERLTKHALYNKVVKRAKRFKAHDEHNACSVGDVVEIMETRPLSKEKRWRVTKIVRKQQEKMIEHDQSDNAQ
jgi:small subunit ribosomal protein S17